MHLAPTPTPPIVAPTMTHLIAPAALSAPALAPTAPLVAPEALSAPALAPTAPLVAPAMALLIAPGALSAPALAPTAPLIAPAMAPLIAPEALSAPALAPAPSASRRARHGALIAPEAPSDPAATAPLAAPTMAPLIAPEALQAPHATPIATATPSASAQPRAPGSSSSWAPLRPHNIWQSSMDPWIEGHTPAGVSQDFLDDLFPEAAEERDSTRVACGAHLRRHPLPATTMDAARRPPCPRPREYRGPRGQQAPTPPKPRPRRPHAPHAVASAHSILPAEQYRLALAAARLATGPDASPSLVLAAAAPRPPCPVPGCQRPRHGSIRPTHTAFTSAAAATTTSTSLPCVGRRSVPSAAALCRWPSTCSPRAHTTTVGSHTPLRQAHTARTRGLPTPPAPSAPARAMGASSTATATIPSAGAPTPLSRKRSQTLARSHERPNTGQARMRRSQRPRPTSSRRGCRSASRSSLSSSPHSPTRPSRRHPPSCHHPYRRHPPSRRHPYRHRRPSLLDADPRRPTTAAPTSAAALAH